MADERCERRGCNVPATFQGHDRKLTCGNHRADKPKRCRGIHISGRRWYDGESTYHSVEVFRDGRRLVYIKYAYGYGDCYLQTAAEWLGANGYPQFGQQHISSGAPRFWGSEWREAGVSWTVADVARKGDL